MAKQTLRLQRMSKSDLLWVPLNEELQLKNIIKQSYDSNHGAVLLFKHSTRCSISSMAKSRLERAWDIDPTKLPTFYLDLLSYRNISSEIATQFNVEHQSPQVLLIKNGTCVYHSSHNEIDVTAIKQILDSEAANN